MPAKTKKQKCEANTCICSGQLITKCSVNGSDKDNKFFYICGPCKVYLRRSGHKIK